MWKQPWGYAEGWAVCTGLFFTGIILQLTIGKVDVDVFHYPANLVSGISFIVLILFLHLCGRKFTSLKWFSGSQAGITSMASVLFLTILMGFTRQISPSADLSSEVGFVRLGFVQMTVSWPFVLLFLYFLLVLGLVTLRRVSSFKWKRDTGFILNHLGLFIALFAAILGSGDLQRLAMTVQVGSTEWRAMNEKDELVELPLAIELKSFTIDEYPPKLMILDNETGAVLPERVPQIIVAEEIPVKGKLLGWDIEITEYLPSAISMVSKDTIVCKETQWEGATSALYVKARKGGVQKEGWISCGSYLFPYASLMLDEEVSLIMPDREPKRFASEVIAYAQDGAKEEQVIEVNKPLIFKGWTIYQLSYDQVKGKWSTISVFELVKDPWLPIVYWGIAMMLAGALYLFVVGGRKGGAL